MVLVEALRRRSIGTAISHIPSEFIGLRGAEGRRLADGAAGQACMRSTTCIAKLLERSAGPPPKDPAPPSAKAQVDLEDMLRRQHVAFMCIDLARCTRIGLPALRTVEHDRLPRLQHAPM
ncbi:hypothetical protein PsYK624_031280 [Phanerochaete sordida]|uniref:Uncharacterized protein n=1 Tax=Phanerochaete sordida TaxID=48140 RepID=A0A9P3G3N1_9APHY|nr:hypothetical protein PsYK624_031280 [Phanerochaete sordida]